VAAWVAVGLASAGGRGLATGTVTAAVPRVAAAGTLSPPGDAVHKLRIVTAKGLARGGDRNGSLNEGQLANVSCVYMRVRATLV
jgi:hypothetical protein